MKKLIACIAIALVGSTTAANAYSTYWHRKVPAVYECEGDAKGLICKELSGSPQYEILITKRHTTIYTQTVPLFDCLNNRGPAKCLDLRR